jgi:hypothetical protein
MPAQRQERFLRSVAGRRQPVGAKADPGKECNQRNVLARLAAERIEPFAEQLL